MKKSTLTSLIAYLDGATVDNLDELRDELKAELNRGEEKAQKNRELYAAAHDVVIRHMAGNCATVNDLYKECEADLPEGFTKSKLQYALREYWAGEVAYEDDGRNPKKYKLKRA